MTPAALLGRVLLRRRRLRARERWTPAQVTARQARALAVLRAHAVARSPFYPRLHAGLESAPLAGLPPVSKAALMGAFDEAVTDRSLRLGELRAYLQGSDGGERFGRYWVAATSGSSGSSRVAASVRNPLVDSTRLDAAAPLAETVARLNALRPEVLIGYASMIRTLAEEQLAGRLAIAPRAVNSASEVLTAAGRALATRAWGVPPFDVYAATETGGFAAECAAHRPAPVRGPGHRRAGRRRLRAGARLLVTVPSSRTLPLIRFELTDRVRLCTETCPCGLPFRLVAGIEGRTDDVLTLPAGAGGTVAVHPVPFHSVLDLVDGAGWQVRQEADGELTVLLAAAGQASTPGASAGR